MHCQTLGEILPNAASNYGDKTALVIGDNTFTFKELDAMSNSVANGLLAKGITSEDTVTLYSQNSWEWIVSYYGIAKTGAVVNPINVMLTPEEVGYVVKDCGAKAIVASPDKGDPLLDLKASGDVAEVILFGAEAPTGALALGDLIRDGKNTCEIVAVDSQKLSTICYTSGTTGHPKGAMQSHKSVLTNTALTGIMHGRNTSDTVVTAIPIAHVYGNVVMNGAMIYGMTLVLQERFNETEILHSIQTHKATIYDGVPTSYMMILAHPEASKYDTTSLKRCTVGGQTMPAAKSLEFEERFGCPLLELWGMTELAGVGVANSWYGENRHGSIGVTVPHVEAKIADSEDATKTVARNKVGELMLKGPIVMQGYYGNEKATTETIEPDGWLHSGDLAKMDDDGYVWVVDRKKDMILTGGYNVYPAEIERVLARHPAVAMAAVGKLNDDIKGEIAKAYVVLKPNEQVDTEDVRNFCKEYLAAYKVPRAVQFVDDLPKTSSGKIMRRELSKILP